LHFNYPSWRNRKFRPLGSVSGLVTPILLHGKIVGRGYLTTVLKFFAHAITFKFGIEVASNNINRK